MLNINFVPDDYIQNKESCRMNMMYIVLLIIVIAALGGSFASIKMREAALVSREKEIDRELSQRQEDIKKVQELQAKSQSMMRTALTTAELIETVPRSILLASLTNTLPAGMSLDELKFVQQLPKSGQSSVSVQPANKFQKASQNKTGTKSLRVNSIEKQLQTYIDIQGYAPSDLEVAQYIERLSNSSVLEHVALVESKEAKVDKEIFRQFKLKTKLRSDIELTQEDIEHIRKVQNHSVRGF